MNSSLFIGATGLKGLSQGMGVIGNNLANVSTYGFKQQNIQYSDLIYSSQGNLGSGWGSQEDSFVTTGEIGHGMAVDSVRSFFLQGSIESTNTVSDLALNGKGFFQVRDEFGEEYYTRTGDFILDQEGFMTTPTGMNLMGYQYDENGNLGGLAKIQLDRFGTIPAKATSSVNFQMNLGSVEDNTVDGDNPYFSLLTTYNATAKPPLAGNAASYQQSVTVYDAEGNKHTLTAYFDGAPSSDNSKRQVEFLLALDQETASENPGDGLVMSGVLTFDSAGKLQGMSAFVPGQAGSQDLSQWQAATAVGGGCQCNINGSPVTIDFGLGNATAAGGAATAAEVGTDATLLGGLTGEALPSSSTAFAGDPTGKISQDGYAEGQMSSYDIDENGDIIGYYSNGQNQKLWQIPVCRFTSEDGLYRQGGNLYSATEASGNMTMGVAGTENFGTINSYSLEMSNVDMATEMVNLIVTQRGFQSNSKVITTADEMLRKAMEIKRT